MEVFECKDIANTVFGRMHSIEEGNKKLYLMFTNQFKPSLKTKIIGTKGYNKAHNAQ